MFSQVRGKPPQIVNYGDIVTMLLVDGLHGLPAQQHYQVHLGDANYRHMVGKKVGAPTWATIDGRFFGGKITSTEPNNYPKLPTALPAKPPSKPRRREPEVTTKRYELLSPQPKTGAPAMATQHEHVKTRYVPGARR